MTQRTRKQSFCEKMIRSTRSWHSRVNESALDFESASEVLASDEVIVSFFPFELATVGRFVLLG